MGKFAAEKLREVKNGHNGTWSFYPFLNNIAAGSCLGTFNQVWPSIRRTYLLLRVPYNTTSTQGMLALLILVSSTPVSPEWRCTSQMCLPFRFIQLPDLEGTIKLSPHGSVIAVLFNFPFYHISFLTKTYNHFKPFLITHSFTLCYEVNPNIPLLCYQMQY